MWLKLIKWIIVLMVALLGANYLSYLQTGRPLFTLDSLRSLSQKLPDMPTIPDLKPTLEKLREQLPQTDTTIEKVYKWRDATGRVHYGDAPPAQARDIEELAVDTRTNVIPALVVPEAADETSEAPTEAPTEEMNEVNAPHSLEGMQQVLQQAREVKALVERRAAERAQLLE